MRAVWLLLLIPLAAVVWVPFYNRSLPSLFGLPFFYWYQVVWVPSTSVLTYLVYRTLRRAPDDDS